MAPFTTRGYRHGDEDSLLAAWNASLPADPIDHATFRRKVLLDANFDPEWLRVAERDGAVAGFCLGLRRRVPLEGSGLDPERAWVTAFGVRPEWRSAGIGTRILEDVVERCVAEGRQQLLIAPYAPNYFVPGVDEARYDEGLAFLSRRGFHVVNRPLSMDASIVTFDYGPFGERRTRLRADGIEVRPLLPSEIPLLIGFLGAHMPGDWLRHAREVLADATRGLASFDQFVVAVREAEVLGYCASEGEHFGPFGVRDEWQGKGIGTVLLATCIEHMRRRGLHNAWVLWTSDTAANGVYARLGFRETRRFAVLARDL
jgi:mycothiol synthase